LNITTLLLVPVYGFLGFSLMMSLCAKDTLFDNQEILPSKYVPNSWSQHSSFFQFKRHVSLSLSHLPCTAQTTQKTTQMQVDGMCVYYVCCHQYHLI